jgi:hypothetical protein
MLPTKTLTTLFFCFATLKCAAEPCYDGDTNADNELSCQAYESCEDFNFCISRGDCELYPEKCRTGTNCASEGVNYKICEFMDECLEFRDCACYPPTCGTVVTAPAPPIAVNTSSPQPVNTIATELAVATAIP